MRWQCCLTALAMLFLAEVPTSLPQSQQVRCEGAFEADVGAYGYKPRYSDPRCEGIYKQKLSSVNLEIVSATLGVLKYDLAAEHLTIFVPELTEPNIDSVTITAVAIPPRTYYRMDALLSPGNRLKWPLSAVLRPLGLIDEQLGVYGWINREGERIIIPVVVGQADAALPNRNAIVEIKVRINTRLVDLKWRIVEVNGKASLWNPIAALPVLEGDVVRIRLPNHSGGIVGLEVVGRNPRTEIENNLVTKVWLPRL